MTTVSSDATKANWVGESTSATTVPPSALNVGSLEGALEFVVMPETIIGVPTFRLWALVVVTTTFFPTAPLNV